MTRKSKAAPAEPLAAQPAEEGIEAIKGFDANFRCRGFQFEVGQTYEHDGPVDVCESGFHAVEGHPLDVLRYYPPVGSRFAIVQQGGALSRNSDGSKLASARITISAELSLGDLAQRAVKWVIDRAKWIDGPVARKNNGASAASGTQGAATAIGYHGAATASGTQGAATASGYQGAATASGYQGAATASGTQGAATASGYHGAATASGYQGAATASGTQGAATASGYHGAAMGEAGNALFLVHRADDATITHAWGGIVGRDGIKPMTWYRLGADGTPQEVAP
jgi:hypothetical protein